MVTVWYLELDPGVYEVCTSGEQGRHLQLRRSEKASLRSHDRADGRTEHRLDAVVLVVHLFLCEKSQGWPTPVWFTLQPYPCVRASSRYD